MHIISISRFINCRIKILSFLIIISFTFILNTYCDAQKYSKEEGRRHKEIIHQVIPLDGINKGNIIIKGNYIFPPYLIKSTENAIIINEVILYFDNPEEAKRHIKSQLHDDIVLFIGSNYISSSFTIQDLQEYLKLMIINNPNQTSKYRWDKLSYNDLCSVLESKYSFPTSEIYELVEGFNLNSFWKFFDFSMIDNISIITRNGKLFKYSDTISFCKYLSEAIVENHKYPWKEDLLEIPQLTRDPRIIDYIINAIKGSKEQDFQYKLIWNLIKSYYLYTESPLIPIDYYRRELKPKMIHLAENYLIKNDNKLQLFAAGIFIMFNLHSDVTHNIIDKYASKNDLDSIWLLFYADDYGNIQVFDGFCDIALKNIDNNNEYIKDYALFYLFYIPEYKEYSIGKIINRYFETKNEELKYRTLVSFSKYYDIRFIKVYEDAQVNGSSIMKSLAKEVLKKLYNKGTEDVSK